MNRAYENLQRIRRDLTDLSSRVADVRHATRSPKVRQIEEHIDAARQMIFDLNPHDFAGADLNGAAAGAPRCRTTAGRFKRCR